MRARLWLVLIGALSILLSPSLRAEEALPRTKIGPPPLDADASATSEANTRVEIACPVTRARTEITTALPSGWWQTPQLGALKDVRSQNIGGETTLMCGYDAYGTTVYVMRKQPPDVQTCAPNSTRTGFVCN